VALVSGANRGLGKETARQLAGRGMAVLVGSRDPVRGDQVAAELASGGAQVEAVTLDVSDPTTIEEVAGRLLRNHGRLDVLVNNAGVVADRPATEITPAEMRRVFEVNVFGVVALTHALLPLLQASRSPRIVNVTSTTASLGLTAAGTDFGGAADDRLAYSTSKAALNMLTLQYAHAFARRPELAHIKINSATPGYTATDLTGYRGTRTVEEGARVIVALAALADDGPTGGFFNDQGPVPW
jgi:NAD(P)-dependent dehydrogenase (short-subunit alcohol dehydrogenase family)